MSRDDLERDMANDAPTAQIEGLFNAGYYDAALRRSGCRSILCNGEQVMWDAC